MKALTVITIGGSTTECHFLSDSLTWPYLLGLRLADSVRGCWLNNAGLDGQSTFGHIVMLNDYVKKLHPSVVVFLTGINDMETPGRLSMTSCMSGGPIPILSISFSITVRC